MKIKSPRKGFNLYVTSIAKILFNFGYIVLPMKHLKIATSILLLFTLSLAAQHKNCVIAHRGAWKANSLPENSIASLKQAIALGCYGSEFDVHLTKDSIIVVNHDNTFYGLPIETRTYTELLTKQHPNGEKIPTLDAYLLEGLKQKKTKLILEIKTSEISPERSFLLTQMCVEAVKKLKAEKQVEYICFSYDVGKLVHQLSPKAKLAYLNGDIAPAQAKPDGYTGLDYHYSVYKQHPEWVKEAKALGLTINSWTVNNKTEMETLLNQKADFITTNEPELLFEVVGEKD
jgi:glycerophosphoryl diester phosphodiesterase